MNNNNTRKLVYAAVIAAIYAVFTMALGALSYKPVILGIELRFSEVLCILPFFFPPAVWGLTIGCAIANIVSTVGFIDVIFGSAATLLAGLCSAAIGKRAKEKANMGSTDEFRSVGPGACIAACAMPVLFNGPIVGAELAWLFPLDEGFWHSFIIFGAQVAAGEAVVMFAGGLTIMQVILKNERFRNFFENMN